MAHQKAAANPILRPTAAPSQRRLLSLFRRKCKQINSTPTGERILIVLIWPPPYVTTGDLLFLSSLLLLSTLLSLTATGRLLGLPALPVRRSLTCSRRLTLGWRDLRAGRKASPSGGCGICCEPSLAPDDLYRAAADESSGDWLRLGALRSRLMSLACSWRDKNFTLDNLFLRFVLDDTEL